MEYTIARTERPACYPERLTDYAHAWDSRDAEYDSLVPDFTSPVVLANAENLDSGGKWADDANVDPVCLGKRKTFVNGDETELSGSGVSYDTKRQRFLFPGGRTGIRGRGLLGRYGPNHAADPIVTRFNPVTGNLEVVVVVRSDCDMIVLPGGMVNPGEDVAKTLYSEFTEEAARPNGAVDRLFTECKRRTVYKGPVDDRRTTDEAWIETVAVHFHAPNDIAVGLVLEVADTNEIRRVMWMPVHEIQSMYASHKMWVDAVARDMASVDKSFTSQAVSAVAAHPLVSAVVAAAIAGVLARYARD